MKVDVFNNNYNQFREYLLSLQDEKYRDFNKSIVLNSKYQMIGVRLPIMRNIAKGIAYDNIINFLKVAKNKYYEEVMIQGLVIARIKEEKLFYSYFKKYLSKIDNWALCDSFCSSIKIVRKYEKKYFQEALNLALDEQEFKARVGIVMILNHFVNKDNLEIIFQTLNKIKSDKFYINMAEAWLICDMYTKYPCDTEQFLKNNSLNSFTQNKAISKIHDSYRVTKEEKEALNKYKK